MMTVSTFIQLLQELAALKVGKTPIIRVTGSYADGTQRLGSDLDFYVHEPRQQYMEAPSGERSIDKVIALFAKYGIPWESCIPGHISSPRDLFTLPIPIEFSSIFEHRKNRMPFVSIYGVKFATW